jgi:hypothetical protein
VSRDEETRKIEQGIVYDVSDDLWIVVDSFPNDIPGIATAHCAPILTPDESPMLDLDVRISRAGGFASLGLLKKINKKSLVKVVTDATPGELSKLHTNLVTWFAVFSYDSDLVTTLPPLSHDDSYLLPGMILGYQKSTICVVDHWACYNCYPLVYVAPVVADLEETIALDVEVTSDYRDLFGKNFYVRTNDFFLVEREELEELLRREKQVPMLRYGASRRISRAMALKFGQLGLLL